MNGVRLAASIVCLTLIPFITQSFARADDRRLVGTLEEVPVGEPSHYGIRVLFQKIGDIWRSFPDGCGNVDCLTSITSQYPSATQWTISFEGGTLGTISAHTPSAFKFYSDIGIQEVEVGQSPPVVGERSADYSGFSGTPVYRPLLATSQAVELRPAHASWISQPANPSDLSRAWPLFKRLVPLIDDCRLDSNRNFIPSNGRIPHREELEVVNKSVNRSRGAIFQARIRASAFKDCDGPSTYRTAFWFYEESTGKIWPENRRDRATD